jgi:hypothetical protein
MPEPELTLAGVTITAGVRKAYLMPNGGGEGNWFSEGEEIRGWRIRRITDNAVALGMDELTIHLPLYDESQ